LSLANKNIILIEMQMDAGSFNNCSIITRGEDGLNIARSAVDLGNYKGVTTGMISIGWLKR
jgi:hypothetical protein